MKKMKKDFKPMVLTRSENDVSTGRKKCFTKEIVAFQNKILDIFVIVFEKCMRWRGTGSPIMNIIAVINETYDDNF